MAVSSGLWSLVMGRVVIGLGELVLNLLAGRGVVLSSLQLAASQPSSYRCS